MSKSPAERSIEEITWASIVIWLGFMLVAGGLHETWLILMVLGIILLSSAIYQRSRRWETSLTIWIFGIWMAVFSVVETVNMLVSSLNEGAGLDISLSVYLGIALVSMGVAGILRVVQGPRTQTTRIPRSGYNTNATSAGTGADPRPRIVTDDIGSGYYDSTNSRSYAASAQNTSTRSRSTSNSRSSTSSGSTRYGSGQQGTQYGSRGQAYDPYNQPTQYASNANGYQENTRQYGSQQDAYRYDGAQYNQQQNQYDYYDETDWDAPPQVQRSTKRTSSKRQSSSSQSASAASSGDLEARVEDIIRRSRERRNVSPDDMDLPY